MSGPDLFKIRAVRKRLEIGRLPHLVGTILIHIQWSAGSKPTKAVRF